MWWKNNNNEVTNKDLLKALQDIKDNHLSHIEKYTGRTNWLLGGLILTVLLTALFM